MTERDSEQSLHRIGFRRSRSGRIPSGERKAGTLSLKSPAERRGRRSWGFVVFPIWGVALVVLLAQGCGAKQEALMPKDVSRFRVPQARLVPAHKSGLRTAETCFNGWDDNGNGLIDEGCGVAQGQIQVSLAWNEADVDLDLFVSDPKGEIARAKAATEVGMTLSADCPTDRAECIEQPFENAYLEEDEVPEGKFIVRARSSAFPMHTQTVEARLGVRSPLGTASYIVQFFEVGQEVRLEFALYHPTSSKASSSESTKKKKIVSQDGAQQ